jgi:hypothetical protein
VEERAIGYTVDGLVYSLNRAGYSRAGVQKGLGYRNAGEEKARI